ncbi:MAG: CHAT domain-containing protein [Balneola sp.]|nr:CHAT domain-containing protein [Balneola sp.]MBO6652079.1 CHAT domain-containing protein [Balneola sp.]MBO6712484.1 CHAT domain-containing protein [Balneola sp.]MBO6801023.1 CHAT domain-containing protein [Balneola sp.]MBO6870695.1 CHAT domain-containing protein [Balneola sp.]
MLQPLANIFKKASSLIALMLLVFSPSAAISQYANVEGDSLLVLGNEVYRKGNYPEAEVIYRKALNKHQNNKSSKEWIIASVGLGASLLDQGVYDKGQKWILRADSSLTEAIHPELRAYVKSNVGWSYKTSRDYSNAQKYYTTALTLANSSGDQYRIAQVSNSLSLLQYQLGYYDVAIKYGRIAVQSFEQIDDPFLLSISYRNLASAFEALGFTEEAEENLLKSYNTTVRTQNNDLTSTVHYYLGSFYHRTGNYDKALANYSKYLSYVKEVGDMPFITPAYTYVASVYLSLGEFEKALEYYNTSVQLDNQNNLPTFLTTRINIAFCYQKLEEFDVARSLYTKILEDQIKSGNTSDAIEIYLRFAELELETGNLKEALNYAEQASGLSQKTESLQFKARSYAAIAKVNARLNNSAAALRFSKKAYNIASLFKGYRLADYLILLSKSYNSVGSDSSFIYAEAAFSEIEREQQSVYGESLESGVFSNYADFYNEVAGWYLEKNNDIEKAFEITERGRARVLLERLSFSESDLQNVVDDATLIALRQKEKNIDRLYRGIENSTDEQSISKLKSELNELEFQYQSFTNELRLQHPKVNPINTHEAIKVSEIQYSLTNKDALIEYMFTDHHLIIFWIRKNKVDYVSVDIESDSPKEYLSGLISEFRTAVQDKATFEVIAQRSQPLFDLLLEPISNKLDGIDNLLIIPSKSLSLLPFDALYTNSSFLIEKFNIKYLPSSTIYKYIEPPHRTTSRELFAVAGSGLNGSTSQTKNYSSLPSTILEVDAISKEFTDVLTLKDQEVSESKIKNSPLNEFRYLHFATHGNVNEINPQQSGLIISELAESEGAFQEDGYLNSKEISSLTFNADLVVLSACNTAVGKIISGEGLQGLQRSFFKAGASSVVVSLWSVYDKSTATFMGSFYKNLSRLEKEEVGMWKRFKLFFNLYEPPMFGYKEKALHTAKKELLEHPYYNHPVYWAPFIMIGK